MYILSFKNICFFEHVMNLAATLCGTWTWKICEAFVILVESLADCVEINLHLTLQERKPLNDFQSHFNWQLQLIYSLFDERDAETY